MSARGPGGRIAPDNRPAQTPGVGAQAKRHDLERRDVPFLHDSDLQQGDVAALEQGLRTAPVQTQDPAGRTRGSATRAQPRTPLEDENPDLNAIIQSELGGTLQSGGGALREPHGLDRTRAWVQWFRDTARRPGVSPLLRAAMMQTVLSYEQLQAQKTQSSVVNLEDADIAIEKFLADQGF